MTSTSKPITGKSGTKQNRKVRYLGSHMSHHASASGYDQLAHCRPNEAMELSADTGLTSKWLSRIFRRTIRDSGNEWYNRAAFMAELSVLACQHRMKNEITHILYGENAYRYSGVNRNFLRRRNNRLVATYHTPQNRLQELIGDPHHISKLDAVILMSECQRPFFEEILPAHRIHFVPHGIDITHWTPPPKKRHYDNSRPLRCLTVGHHLRDFDVLANTARQANQLDIEFVVVAWPDRVKKIANLSNVTCVSGVSDEQLLAMYHDADLLLLPLLDATANNSILEGMACGLPIVTTDIQGIRDYVPPEVLLAPLGDADAIFQYLQKFLSDQFDLTNLSRASRNRAEQLSWTNVRKQLDEIYGAL